MNQVTSTENDDLTCPITLELFRDPVVASDGHVYEREAITRWILQHGTSPLTREPLNINDLQADDRLRRLAARRRNSTVSFDARDNTVTLPPLRGILRNTARVAPILVANSVSESRQPKTWLPLIICLLVTSLIIAMLITVTIVFGKNISETRSTVSYRLEITSNYASALTMNSPVFTRPGFSSNQFYYKAIQVQVLVAGPYRFKSVSYEDMYGYLYWGYFNTTNPYMNLLLEDDDSGGYQQFSLRLTLVANNYTLVATTYSAYARGSFSIVANGPASVSFY